MRAVSDLAAVATLVASFAVLVTAHVAVVGGLALRPPRWRAIVALVVPPAAPYWAWREKMRARAIAWAAALVVYLIAMATASR